MGKDFILNPDLQSDDEDDAAVGGGVPDDDGWIWVRKENGELERQKEEPSASKKPRRKVRRPNRRRS